MKIRRDLLLLTLLGMGAAIAVAVRDETLLNVVEPVNGTAMHKQTQLKSGAELDRYVLTKRPMPAEITSEGIFATQHWRTTPAPVPQIIPPALISVPAIPNAPSLPFIFAGRVFDQGEVTVFLSKDGQPYTAKVDDVLDNDYRVKEITSTQLVLTYLPLDIEQVVRFNSSDVARTVLGGKLSTSLKLAPAS